MGTCCSQRDDRAVTKDQNKQKGKEEKKAADINAANPTTGAQSAAVQFNQMDHVRTTVTNILAEGKLKIFDSTILTNDFRLKPRDYCLDNASDLV